MKEVVYPTPGSTTVRTLLPVSYTTHRCVTVYLIYRYKRWNPRTPRRKAVKKGRKETSKTGGGLGLGVKRVRP